MAKRVIKKLSLLESSYRANEGIFSRVEYTYEGSNKIREMYLGKDKEEALETLVNLMGQVSDLQDE